ncbi:MAG: DUF1343 domain-containing protein [Deltaproteobacteria bacterium]|nr:DUF1343 domain-containing protein [Deltaproteobacteria bacterium]
MTKVASGLDRFREAGWKRFRQARLGLLCNQASVDAALRPAGRVVADALPGGLRALFGPQHGYGGEDQDNMIETDHAYDADLGVPVYSLYADRREPLPEMLEEIDVLIVDLQDAGTRVYTFASTLLNCMRAAARSGRRVVVLDRPNPLGGDAVEGNLLAADMHSFVGPARIPMRHGLTMGELALYFKGVLRIDVDLEVIRMAGWRRAMLWKETGLRWVMPSPNMPLPETALVYPGQVLWEGTNVSEGRGTCRPFEIFGAPFLRPERLLTLVPSGAVEGAVLQPFSFKPTFHKWAEQPCRGFLIHVLDAEAFQPYLASLALLCAVLRDAGERFAWRDPPYEYETERLPIDLILGDTNLRKAVEGGAEPLELREGWQEDLSQFREQRHPCLLYPS